MMPRVSGLISLLAIAALTACAQTDAALELANKTNAVALSLKGQIEDFSATQRTVGELEAARLGDMLKNTVEIETDLADVLSESPTAQTTLYRGLRTRADQVLTAEGQAAAQAETLRQQLVDGLAEFSKEAEKLDALSAPLVILGEEKSFEDNVAFFIAFGKSVKEAADKAKAERDHALNSAASSK